MNEGPDGSVAGAVEREREYYDRGEFHRGTAAIARNLIHRSIGEFNSFPELFEMFDPVGREVLDYGCGRGYIAVRIAQAGASHVTGIDVSRAEVEHAESRAADAGVSDRVSFLVGDAHATPFADESFDLIVGAAILHHLDLERSLIEVRRLLRPGGEAVFIEPLLHNPLLRIGRRLSPGARTTDEHPLTPSDWELCARTFDRFAHTERELVTIPLMPLNLVLPKPGQARLAVRAKEWDDKVLRRFPGLGKYARVTFLQLGR